MAKLVTVGVKVLTEFCKLKLTDELTVSCYKR